MATFLDTGDNSYDMLKFVNGTTIALDEFADHGIEAYVGAMPAAGEAEDITEQNDVLAHA